MQMMMVVNLMATRYVYTCDICNREIKNSKIHTLAVDEPECRYDLRKALMHRIYGKTSYQRLEVCNQCYSKLRKYVKKLKEK